MGYNLYNSALWVRGKLLPSGIGQYFLMSNIYRRHIMAFLTQKTL